MKAIFTIFSVILFLSNAKNVIAQSGAALNFDGINDYIDILPNSNIPGSGTVSVEAWINCNTGAGNLTWFKKGTTNGYGLYVANNIINVISYGVINWNTNVMVTAGTWTHVAFTFDGTTQRIYKNGILSASISTGYLAAPDSAFIGANFTGSEAGYFSGSVDELRIWNRALTQLEIQNNMNCELSGVPSGLVAYYKFNQGLAAHTNTGITTLYDSSGNNMNGTLINFMLSGIHSNWISPGGVQNGNYCAHPLYTFNGNGNWTDSMNWLNRKIPPVILAGGSEVVINPAGNGVSILNRVQYISSNARLTVRQDKKFTIRGDLNIYEKPAANFNFTASDPETLPVSIVCNNTSTGSNDSYSWSFGNGMTSTQQNPTNLFSSGGIYNIKLVVTNAIGSDSITKQIKISPYPQAYINFNGEGMNLFSWEGNKVMILSRNSDLNRTAMFKWLKAMDTTYGYYKKCTGQDPALNTNTYIDNRTTIADVPSTCGAGCGYLGFTGIEMLNSYFDVMYNAINDNNQYDQEDFYEFGRNFWFYGDQLAYKTDDPVVTGYAVFMRFMAMQAAGVDGAPFGSYSFSDFQNQVIGLIDLYLADPSLNWANTLGIGQGVPGAFGGGTDLFASFCFRLRRDYGGDAFVQNLWKKAGLRAAAITTQDAVDNFFLASCAAANKNLTALFQSWKWTISTSAITEALQYP